MMLKNFKISEKIKNNDFIAFFHPRVLILKPFHFKEKFLLIAIIMYGVKTLQALL